MKLKKALTISLYIVAIFLIVQPFIPKLINSLNYTTSPTNGYVYQSERTVSKSAELGIKIEKLKPTPLENTLVIPKIKVDARIHEGQSESTLDKGVWRRPNTSEPDKGSNTVLAAHRYMSLTAPNSFYNLDKLEIGDEIIIYWEGEEKVYKVDQTKTVPATEIEIEDPSENEKITLYTCEPLYTAENRLVVTATPITDAETNDK